MRITNPNADNATFYAGTCKNNAAPKHVTADGTARKDITIDGKKATMFDSPGSKKYIYIQTGTKKDTNWLYIEDKSVFQLDELTSTKVTRTVKTKVDPVELEETIQPS